MPRLKVKDMPRKQQMAVKATMADGGKGNPNKMKASALKLKNHQLWLSLALVVKLQQEESLKYILVLTLTCGLLEHKKQVSAKRF